MLKKLLIRNLMLIVVVGAAFTLKNCPPLMGIGDLIEEQNP